MIQLNQASSIYSLSLRAILATFTNLKRCSKSQQCSFNLLLSYESLSTNCTTCISSGTNHYHTSIEAFPITIFNLGCPSIGVFTAIQLFCNRFWCFVCRIATSSEKPSGFSLGDFWLLGYFDILSSLLLGVENHFRFD